MTGYSELPLEDDVVERRFAGDARVLGPSWMRMPALTVGHFGPFQASPYLVSLGLSKSSMAIVLLSGPLSGLIVQPLIGILADNCKSRFGRRRPFILVGTVICCCATLLLGYTRPVASIFSTLGSHSNDALTIYLAILAIYCIDFSGNVAQILNRVLIVDTLHTSQQPKGNAWAARMTIIGGITGFFIGNLDLPSMIPILGTTQLEVWSVITCSVLLGTHLWMALSVRECVLIASSGPVRTLRQELLHLLHIFQLLPRVIRQIFAISAFSSLAGFPMLFYSSLYIGELYKNSLDIDISSADPSTVAAVDAETTRLASRALLYSVLVSLIMNLILPALVIRRDDGEDGCASGASKSWAGRWAGQAWWMNMKRTIRCMHLATLWAIGHAVFATCMASTIFTTTVKGGTLMITVTGVASAIGQWVPWALLGEAIRSPHSSARFTEVELGLRSMMGVDDGECQRLVEEEQEDMLFSSNYDRDNDDSRGAGERTTQVNDSAYEESSDNSWHDDPGSTRRSVMGSSSLLMHGQVNDPDRVPMSRWRRQAGVGLTAQAGSIMGVHNIFIVIPQFVATGIASFLFMILDPAKSDMHRHQHPTRVLPPGMEENTTATVSHMGDEGMASLATRVVYFGGNAARMQERDADTSHTNAVAVVFQLGAIAAMVACVLSYRLSRELQRGN